MNVTNLSANKSQNEQQHSGQTPEAVAEAAGVCPRTVRKWVDRYHREGLDGLNDRSSRPHRLRRPTPESIVRMIERLRRQRWTGKQIAVEAGVSPATVSRVLRRLGLNKLSTLEPEPVRRYEREHPRRRIEIGGIWEKQKKTGDGTYFSLSADTGFGKLNANLGRFPGQDDESLMAVIAWR